MNKKNQILKQLIDKANTDINLDEIIRIFETYINSVSINAEKEFEPDILALLFFFDNRREILNQLPLLKKYYNLTLFRNLYIYSELRKIYADCRAANILPPILLKGAAFLVKLYAADFGVRHLNDIDILVLDEAQYNAVIDILLKNGYRNTTNYKETFIKNNIKIDVHTEFINSIRISAREKIWKFDNKKIQYYSINDFLVLEDNLDFIYTLLHSILHHNINQIKWLVDLKLLLIKKNISSDNVFELAKSFDLITALRLGLTAYSFYFDLDNNWIIKFKLYYKKRIVAYILNSNELYAKYLFNLLLLRWHDKIKLLFTLIFPNIAILKQRYKKDTNIISLYFKHFYFILFYRGNTLQKFKD